MNRDQIILYYLQITTRGLLLVGGCLVLGVCSTKIIAKKHMRSLSIMVHDYSAKTHVWL